MCTYLSFDIARSDILFFFDRGQRVPSTYSSQCLTYRIIVTTLALAPDSLLQSSRSILSSNWHQDRLEVCNLEFETMTFMTYGWFFRGSSCFGHEASWPKWIPQQTQNLFLLVCARSKRAEQTFLLSEHPERSAH